MAPLKNKVVVDKLEIFPGQICYLFFFFLLMDKVAAPLSFCSGTFKATLIAKKKGRYRNYVIAHGQ